MKLNWGTSIAIFYTCFVAIMVIMVFRSTQNQMDLVQEDYYQQDLDYEAFRQSRQNSMELSEAVTIDYSFDNQVIKLTFPKNMQALQGEMKLFRPSDKNFDTSIPLHLNSEAGMSIPVTNEIPEGLWRVQIKWEANGQKYYKETSIVI